MTEQPPGAAGQEFAGGGYPQQPQHSRHCRRRNRLALASLITGLAQYLSWFLLARWTIGYVLGFAAALLALCLGAVALWQISRRREGDRGIAVAGMALGAGGLLWPLLFVLMAAVVGGFGVPI